MIMQARPDTMQTPVTMLPPGGTPSYMPSPASWQNSRNGEPGSSSAEMRSRGKSCLRSLWSRRARSGPPSMAAARRAWRSAIRPSYAARLRRNSSLAADMSDFITAIAGDLVRSASFSDCFLIATRQAHHVLADVIENHFAVEGCCLQQPHQRIDIEDAIFLGEAVAAEALQRDVDGLGARIGGGELCHVGEFAGLAALVENPRRLHRHQG